ncbi:MAG: tRNA preQ1(34) S-adenosylmethionine ribosyltransferase-isomerase QueA [Pirellulales bacterium]|nr:tRNA preQ1(34) S-adenosylmethionine ribosyltransferase-isomerase QueA [Pirellulales bacterium]
MSELDQYDYELPEALIAQHPLANRADSRLMVVDRRRGRWSHRHIRDLPELLAPGDTLVVNDTKVVPARLLGRRMPTAGRWEGLFLSVDAAGFWRVIGKCRGKLRPGERIQLIDRRGGDDIGLFLVERHDGGVWTARPDSHEDAWTILGRLGRVPLPCYIRGGEMIDADLDRYQTVYAATPGSAAAPTAGLHFTPALLSMLEDIGVERCRVTLHVGLDTFRPIQVDSLAEHMMHTEWGHLDAEATERIRRRRQDGGRVVAVGTTTVRVLETAAASGELRPWTGQTNLFIRPGFRFHVVDALLTNFHLPRSTLLVLVRAFGGDELMRDAYREAVREQYRFYSYGDAMLIV